MLREHQTCPSNIRYFQGISNKRSTQTFPENIKGSGGTSIVPNERLQLRENVCKRFKPSRYACVLPRVTWSHLSEKPIALIDLGEIYKPLLTGNYDTLSKNKRTEEHCSRLTGSWWWIIHTCNSWVSSMLRRFAYAADFSSRTQVNIT